MNKETRKKYIKILLWPFIWLIPCFCVFILLRIVSMKEIPWKTLIPVFIALYFLTHLYNIANFYHEKWLSRKWEKKMRKKYPNGIPENLLEDDKNGIITIRHYGFQFQDKNGSVVVVLWEDVHGIGAYKRDLFSIDELRFGFIYGKDKNFLSVSEDMTGFHQLIKVIESRYPSIPEDWMRQVIFPPFATNPTILWRRDESIFDEKESEWRMVKDIPKMN